MKKIYFPVALLSFFLMSCGGWTDARKQTVRDKCDGDIFDCDCFLKTTMDVFEDPNAYTSTLENESANQEQVDAYWDKLYEDCMTD